MSNDIQIEPHCGLGEGLQMVTDDMVALVPQLHTFARSLCRDGVRADDLVQEALMRAINNIQRFKPGTNLKAWLFTIVRNEHYSQLRRGKFEAHGVDIELLPEPSVPPDHDGKLELRDLNRALASLSPGQRTALILVSVSGFSYEEAAEICGCAVGTIKSRVARARETLLELLEGHQPMAAVPDEDLLFSPGGLAPGRDSAAGQLFSGL
ncbi:MAG TPA: sigma-70 family RNA polymerase sigma factor [Steroidobacteraceae bacterium]|jgi:RNA polymerase sigma-70 factor (ECF subfamily)|nr:sigma-70 family RNA polymerase sigma factor [Steroidobacteraceae bacterium]